MRIALALATLLAGVALVGAACGGDDEASDTTATTDTDPTEPIQAATGLKGSVGPGFEISLVTEDGEPIASLPAGGYELEVEDLAPDHNFHLSGPGDVDVATEVAEEGTESFTVELEEPGEYLFVCDPHRESMNGMFVVE
jgi:Copper binding proteins, plastocyanin/azurin family